MKWTHVFACVVLCGSSLLAGPIKHKFVASDESGRQILYVDQADPSKNWTVTGIKTRDIQLIGKGRIMVSTETGYREYELATGKLLKKHEPFKKGRVRSVQRLPDGRTIIGIERKGVHLVELDTNDKELRRATCGAPAKALRLMRPTAKGTVLLGSSDWAIEVDMAGKVVWKAKIPGAKHIYEVIRNADGNIMLTGGYGGFLAEIDSKGKILRTMGKAGKHQGVNIRFFSDFQQLPNGNIVVCNWHGHGRKDSQKGPQLLEFDKAGKLVWKWHDPKMAGCLHGVIILDNLDSSKLHDNRCGMLAPAKSCKTCPKAATCPLAAKAKPTAKKLVGKPAAKPVLFGQLKHEILSTGSRRMFILSPEGKITWQLKCGGNVTDVWALPNGNVLVAAGSFLREYTRAGKKVWEYVSKVQKGGGVFGCQRLANGNTVIGENSTGKILELDKDGKVLVEFVAEPNPRHNHGTMRFVRKLSNGNYLACIMGRGEVREYNAKGKVVWKLKPGGKVFAAVRLPNGNTMACTLNEIAEFTAKGKKIWSFKKADIPDLVVGVMTGFQVLPNGNIMVGCYSAYNRKTGKGNGIFEITRDKKLVWRYANPKADRAMMGIQKLGIPGDATKGEVLR